MSKTGTGMGRIYQRGVTKGQPAVPGKIWWIQYGHRGKIYRESSESTKESVARALLKKRLAEMGRGKLIGPSEERVTLGDLATMVRDDYKVNGRKSSKRLETALVHLTEYFGTNRALDITTDRIRSYIVARQGEGAANASIQKELAALRRGFNLAKQAGRLTTTPHIPGVKVQNTRSGFLSAADVDAVCAHLPAALRPVVRFAFLTGWRKGEILPLQWSQVDFDAGVVRLEPGTTKNDDGRTFPFHVLAPLRALLEDQREQTRTLERETGRIITAVFHRSGKAVLSVDGAWRAAATAAGLPGALFHDLRRSAVRNMEAAGVSRSVAMKLSGHRTESIFRRYAIADSVALAEGVEKLAKLHAGTAEPRKVIPIGKRTAG